MDDGAGRTTDLIGHHDVLHAMIHDSVLVAIAHFGLVAGDEPRADRNARSTQRQHRHDAFARGNASSRNDGCVRKCLAQRRNKQLERIGPCMAACALPYGNDAITSEIDT